MKTDRILDFLHYGSAVKCIDGPFKGKHLTKNQKGHAFLVEEDIVYDFWDTRFASCTWQLP